MTGNAQSSAPYNQQTHLSGDLGTNFISHYSCGIANHVFCGKEHGTKIQVIHIQRPIFSMRVKKSD